jgi:hypothetical protein
MRLFSTIQPPAAISFFTPTEAQFGYPVVMTNMTSDASLIGAQIRSAFESAQKELGRYGQYSVQWDGYRARPFSSEVLSNAAQILGYSQYLFLDAGIVPELVTTGPASDGSVDVELRVADKRVLITLYPQEEQVRLSSFDAQEAHEQLVPLGEQTLETWFTWLNRSNPLPGGVGHDPLRPRRGEAVEGR